MEMKLVRSTLREWRKTDEASIVKHANNKNVSMNLADVFPFPYTVDDARAWIARHDGIEPQRDFAIAIDGNAVGGVGIYLAKGIHQRSGEIGYWLGEEFWGRGIVTEAVRAMTKYAFETFDLIHIFAGLFE